jgi:hypothetical protein
MTLCFVLLMCAGMLEAFSYVVRMFSGVISDKMTSRKAAITAGFAMGAMAKFGMSGAVTTVQLFVTKAIDRLGNGVQVSRSQHAKLPPAQVHLRSATRRISNHGAYACMSVGMVDVLPPMAPWCADAQACPCSCPAGCTP